LFAWPHGCAIDAQEVPQADFQHIQRITVGADQEINARTGLIAPVDRLISAGNPEAVHQGEQLDVNHSAVDARERKEPLCRDAREEFESALAIDHGFPEHD
jgi:hypothetical protein